MHFSGTLPHFGVAIGLLPEHHFSPMKPALRTPAFRLMAALAAGLGFSSLSLAQSVTTPPVGAVSTTLSTGYSLVGLTLLNPATYSGQVSANAVGTVTVSGTVNFATLLNSADFYYIEVTNGALEGDRFDVNTAATIASANGTITLDTASVNNTFTLTSNALATANFVLRKHITLNSLAASLSPAFVGNNSLASADQVLIFNKALNAFDTYFLRSDNITWRKFGSTSSVGATTLIPPGVGIFIRKASAASTLTQIGEVRTNIFALPLSSGLTLVAPGYPVSNSPVSIGASLANGWLGNNSLAAADQIITYSPGANSYLTYFLRSDGASWRKFGFTTDVRSTLIVNHDSGFWIRRNTSDVNFALVRPFTL